MNKIISLFLFFLITSIQVQSQTADSISQEVIQITTSLTSKHVRISKIPLYMIVPKGYTVNQFASKLTNGKSKIEISYHPNSDYSEFYDGVNSYIQKIVSLAILKEKKYYILNNNKALCLDFDVTPTSDALIFSFGNSNYFILMMGSYPKGDQKERDNIKKAFLTAYYQKETNHYSLKFKPFYIDENKGGYQFQEYSNEKYIYIKKGQTSEDRFEVLALDLGIARSIFDLNMMESWMFEYNSVFKKIFKKTILVNTQTINNHEVRTYRLVKKNKADKAPEILYLVLPPTYNFVLVFKGIGKNYKTLKKDMDKVLKTIHFK